jgi:hypothetical protein
MSFSLIDGLPLADPVYKCKSSRHFQVMWPSCVRKTAAIGISRSIGNQTTLPLEDRHEMDLLAWTEGRLCIRLLGKNRTVSNPMLYACFVVDGIASSWTCGLLRLINAIFEGYAVFACYSFAVALPYICLGGGTGSDSYGTVDTSRILCVLEKRRRGCMLPLSVSALTHCTPEEILRAIRYQYCLPSGQVFD